MIPPDSEAIIFDCDGTLVDSEPITVRVLIGYSKNAERIPTDKIPFVHCLMDLAQYIT